MRLPDPRGLEFRPKRSDQQYRPTLDSFDNQIEQLTGGRVDPLQILEYDQHGQLARQSLELIQPRAKGLLLFALGRQTERRITA